MRMEVWGDSRRTKQHMAMTTCNSRTSRMLVLKKRFLTSSTKIRSPCAHTSRCHDTANGRYHASYAVKESLSEGHTPSARVKRLFKHVFWFLVPCSDTCSQHVSGVSLSINYCPVCGLFLSITPPVLAQSCAHNNAVFSGNMACC